MKLLAFNGSPRGKHSNTDRILQPFLEGASSAGSDVETETVYLKDYKINHCLGCFTCWTKTPGVCIQKDGLQELMEKAIDANIMIFATPLYIFTVSGLMKNFMDRLMMGLAKPYIIKRGEYYTHPSRYNESFNKRIVLISNCGFPGRYNFAGLVETFKILCEVSGSELLASILCPMGELLSIPQLLPSLDWYLEAVKKAGKEILVKGHMDPETEAILKRNLMKEEEYVMLANAYFEDMIKSNDDN